MRGKKWTRAGLYLLVILAVFLCLGQNVQAKKKVKVRTPSGFKAADYDKNYIRLTWRGVPKAKGYILYRYNPLSRRYERFKKTSRLYYNMCGIQSGTFYHFKIKAYTRVKKKVYYSKISRSIRVKTKKEPIRRVSTIKTFLKTAIQPIGKAVYVWGGGWSTDSLGGTIEARSMGVSSRWMNFFNAQTQEYNFYNTMYQRHDGLDCSGYVGWCIYNILNKKSGNNGYVMKAETMARNYASRGWGTFKKRGKVKRYRPGDIMSSSCSDCGHVWIVIGQCEDGSVVALHSSSNAGVQLSGTVTPDGNPKSQAVALVKKYMKQYYPGWCDKFKTKLRDIKYLTHFCQMSWDVSGNTIMTDPEGYQNLNAAQVLEDLLGPVI